MARPTLRAVDVDSLDLDLPEDVVGPTDHCILDEEDAGVGLTIDYRSLNDDAAFAIFANCRPTMRGDPDIVPDPYGALQRELAAQRGIGKTPDGSVRVIAGLPALHTTLRVEDLHEADLCLVTGDRLCQSHVTSDDPALTRAAMALVEERLLPQFLATDYTNSRGL